jgi:hypothetical protein
MMIGAVLVIWVMCIMPLMTATGTAAYKTQGNYDDYLQSRSAIEFCKSELEKIVEEKIPYTFAVTGDLNGGFQAVAKWNDTGISVRGEYSALVTSPDSLNDRKDYPTSDSVRAICAVEPNHENPNIYDIVITTYHNCEKGMTYTATFTPKGSLLIHPEAYKQNQEFQINRVRDALEGERLYVQKSGILDREFDSFAWMWDNEIDAVIYTLDDSTRDCFGGHHDAMDALQYAANAYWTYNG